MESSGSSASVENSSPLSFVVPWVAVRPTGVRNGDQVLTTRDETSECQTTNTEQTTDKYGTKPK